MEDPILQNDITNIDSNELGKLKDVDTDIKYNSQSEKKESKNISGLIKNIFLNNIYQFLIIIVPLITTPYVSKVLQPAGVGISSYTNSILTYFTMFAALGTVGYGTREIARARDDKHELSKAFWEIELITIFTSAVCLLGWIGVCFIYKKYQLYLFLWTFCIFGSLFDISWLFAGLEKYKYTVSINMAFKIASCICIFIFVKTFDDLWKYVLIYSLSSMLGNLSMWVFLPKVLVKAKPDFHNLKKHFRETLIYFIPVVASVLYAVLDKTLIGAITQNENYSGQYESATKVINLCKIVGFAAVVNVMSSRSNYLYKINAQERIKALTLGTLNIASTLSIAVSFGIVSVSEVFVPLFFGEGYEMTIVLMNILSPVIFLLSITDLCGGLYFIPAGKRLESAMFLIIGSTINLLFNIVLIKMMGPKGACISTLLSEMIIATLYLTYCKTITWIDLLKTIWKKIIAGCVMYIVLAFFAKLTISSPYVDLLLRVVIGACVYFVVLYALRDNVFKILKVLKKV